MGRRYVRDNRGRFASTGATARGGRLRTEAGNKRETQTMQVKGGGSKLRNRNQVALHNAASRGDKSALAALRAQRKGPLKPARKDTKDQGWGTGLDQGGAPKRAYAKPPANTLKNQTGSSKTLNKFNSRPERTRGAYVGGRYVDKAKLTGRQPLDLGRGDDKAYGRVATKSARARSASKSGAGGDTAMVNIPMSGSRGRRLDAEITRNVKAQKAADRAASRALGRQFKSDTSRAKKLRSVHEKAVVAKYSVKMGKPAAEVRSAIRTLEPSRQVKFFKQWVKENRAAARR